MLQMHYSSLSVLCSVCGVLWNVNLHFLRSDLSGGGVVGFAGEALLWIAHSDGFHNWWGAVCGVGSCHLGYIVERVHTLDYVWPNDCWASFHLLDSRIPFCYRQSQNEGPWSLKYIPHLQETHYISLNPRHHWFSEALLFYVPLGKRSHLSYL